MEDTFMRDIYTIQIHRTTNVENRSPNCEVCQNGVIHLTSLQVRQFTQSGKLPNVCKVCNKEFLKVCRMQIRHLTQPEAQMHICDVCQKSFIHAGNLRKHKLQHIAVAKKNQELLEGSSTNSQTEEKDKNCTDMVQVKIDPENKEADPDESSATNKTEQTEDFRKIMCFCKLCSKQFKDEFCFTRHCQVHSEKQNFFCGICKKSFENKSSLRNHNRDEHEINQQYVCNICSAIFPDMVILKDHCLEQHNNIANGQISSDKDILGRPIFTCEHCDKHFIQKVAYERHCQLHVGTTPLYQCQVCHKTYIQPGRLKIHQRLHKKTQFFTCETCNKTFQLKSAFAKHCQSHCNGIEGESLDHIEMSDVSL